jgi:hypothetical protein
VELEQNADRIRAHGLGIAAISYDSVEATRQFTERMHISFPLLSDTGSEVIKRYGILNETVDPKSAFYGIPHPGTYVLDAKGEITAKYFEEDYKTRDTSALILLRHFGLSPVPAHQPVSAKHIGLSPSSTATEGRTGQRLTLTIDGELAPKMHIYAPGTKGYIPIALTIDKSAGFSADQPIYPPSKTMRIKVIKETVPVYEGKFRVMQTIRLADAPELEPLLDKDRNLSIHATFRYQACDDKECYMPETVPLTWTVHVLPLDRVRVTADAQKK